MENPIKMDDLGVPLFSETTISIAVDFYMQLVGIHNRWSSSWNMIFWKTTLDVSILREHDVMFMCVCVSGSTVAIV